MTTEAAALTCQEDLRRAMPITDRWAYFDHAAVAPLSAPAADAIADWAAEARDQGDTVWLNWEQRVENTRRRAAKLLGASPSEIALVTSTTHGINLVAEGVDWRDTDNVVVLADEFPSNLYPWMQQRSRGVEVRLVSTDDGRVSLDRLRGACDARTRVVSFSWVGYSNGVRRDIDTFVEIAKACGANGGQGAWVLLDAIQGLGVFPLDVSRTPIDFLAADGHKWLLGPEGAGIAYVRQERLEDLRATGVGWKSVVGANQYGSIDLTLKPDASRFEGGSTNMSGQIALGASLDLILGYPRQEVAAAVLGITDFLCERLRDRGATVHSDRQIVPGGHDPRSGIVSASLADRDPDELRKQCAAAGVAVSVRHERLRMSPHAYTSHDDVDRLIDALS